MSLGEGGTIDASVRAGGATNKLKRSDSGTSTITNAVTVTNVGNTS